MNFGRVLPHGTDLPSKFHPKVNAFTDEFVGGMYKYEGLNCAFSYSNVHA